jgi:hypothetical protein
VLIIRFIFQNGAIADAMPVKKKMINCSMGFCLSTNILTGLTLLFTWSTIKFKLRPGTWFKKTHHLQSEFFIAVLFPAYYQE